MFVDQISNTTAATRGDVENQCAGFMQRATAQLPH